MNITSENINKRDYLKKNAIFKNPFIIFLPFLLFYLVYVLVFYNKTLWGDEVRHVEYATHLLDGFYSPPPPKVVFDMGPGYPLFLSFFLALGIPLVFACLVNAIFNYLAVVFLFKALKEIISFKVALICSIFMACYYNSLEFIALMYSETITLFLVALVLYLLIKAFNSNEGRKTKKYIWLSGFFIGYLVLTKIIFGYVLMIMLAAAIVLWIIKRKNTNYRKFCIVFLIAMATASPYLAYTYHLTGRLFYWGTSGGINLYWMSTPFEGEYGNWVYNPKYNSAIFKLNLRSKDNYIPGGEDSIKKHHQKDFEELQKYDGVEEDDAYKKIVMTNIKSHPLKFLQNCISNIGRMIFNYPYSYTAQKPGTLLRLPMNGIIVTFLLFSLIPTFINWRKLIFSLRIIIFIVLLYIGGNVLGCAETRMFTPIVPMILFWIAYIMNKSIRVNLAFK